MSELNPCPKCGQPVCGKVTGGIASFGCGEYGYDVDCKCGISFSTVCCFETPEEAEEYGIRQWNTRTERTCVPRVVPRSFSGDSEPSFYQAICDCGWIVGEDGASSLSDFEHVDPYCGGCGAKVVSA